MGKNSDSEKTKPKDFTVDSEKSGVTEMPSITTLLDRKSGSKLLKRAKVQQEEKTRVLTKSSSKSEKTKSNQIVKNESALPEEGIQIALNEDAPNGIQFSFSGNATADSDEGRPTAPAITNDQTRVLEPTAQVQKSKRTASTKSGRDLVKWDLEVIQSGKDPVYVSLQKILKSGGSAFVFLNVKVADAKATKVIFEALAGHGDTELFRLWRGLKWDPHVVPELWNHFVKHGASELSPPGTMTQLASSRNVVRGVFGVRKDEWLTLFRVGPAESCRGILVVLSKVSLQTVLADILKSLEQVVK